VASFDWREHRAAFFDGFHRSLPAYAEAGNNLIVEHIFDTPDWVERVATLLAPFDVFFVGPHVPLDELVRREAARGDGRLETQSVSTTPSTKGCATTSRSARRSRSR